MQGKKKNLIHIGILIVLVTLTFYVLLKDQNMDEMAEALKSVSVPFVLVAILFGLSRIYGEAISFHMIFKSLNDKATFMQCIKYAAVGFLLSGITPSASGGQPAQILYMKRDKHSIANCGLCLVLLTVVCRATVVLFGIAIFVLSSLQIYRNLGKVQLLFYLGLGINFFLFAGFLFLLCSGGKAKKFVRFMIHVLAKCRIVRKEEVLTEKSMSVLEQYEKGAVYMKGHVSMLIKLIIVNLIQRSFMFLVPYFIYCSWGLSGHSAAKIMLLQSVVSICADMLPLPGGVFANEKCYVLVMEPIFKSQYVLPSMLLSRGISFYFLLLFSGLIVFVFEILRLRQQYERST